MEEYHIGVDLFYFLKVTRVEVGIEVDFVALHQVVPFALAIEILRISLHQLSLMGVGYSAICYNKMKKKGKGLSFDQKRDRMLAIFHRTVSD